MTPKKPIKKTPSQLAEESWMEIELLLLEEMRMKMTLYKMGFVKGYKCSKEDQDGIRPRQKKK